MIIVHGTLPIKAGAREEALRLARWMAHLSQREAGCISYEFYVGLTDPNKLMLFQEWETEEALEDHFQTDHMEQFLAQLPEVLDGQVATRRYAVEIDDDDPAVDESIYDETVVSSGGEPPIIH